MYRRVDKIWFGRGNDTRRCEADYAESIEEVKFEGELKLKKAQSWGRIVESWRKRHAGSW